MATTQSTYSETTADAIAGNVADTSTHDARTYICETSAGIAFGVAVQQGADANKAKVGIATGKFIGITIKDPTRAPDDSDKYDDGANMAVLYRGTIWVKAESAVTVGADVTAKTTTGALSSAAAATGQIAISGARWMTAASAGKLAQVQLSGALPSA